MFYGAGEMTHQLRPLAVIAEDLGSVSSYPHCSSYPLIPFMYLSVYMCVIAPHAYLVPLEARGER